MIKTEPDYRNIRNWTSEDYEQSRIYNEAKLKKLGRRIFFIEKIMLPIVLPILHRLMLVAPLIFFGLIVWWVN